jgi:hypothetical protein
MRVLALTITVLLGVSCFTARAQADVPNRAGSSREAIYKALAEKQGEELLDLIAPWNRGADQVVLAVVRGYGTNLTGAAILEGLTEKQGVDLYAFIKLCYIVDKPHLSDQEIDRIVERLLIIQSHDAYQRKVPAKVPSGTVDGFVNRGAAADCVYKFRFQKLANALRREPMPERVRMIIHHLDHPPIEGCSTRYWFTDELVRAGSNAVPYMIQYKPCRYYLVDPLAELGDPRGIDYLIELLKTQHDIYAAGALVKFNDKKVIPALLEALRDDKFEGVYREAPVEVEKHGKPYLGRFYRVQQTAAECLSKVTGKNWGLVYNEDYITWEAWLRAGRPDGFKPGEVSRTDKDVARLVEYLFHRYMSGRPNSWQPQNSFMNQGATGALAADLKQLGIRVVPAITNECRIRIKESPLWKDELGNWTKSLLVAFEWPEATRASESLGTFRSLSGRREAFMQ